MSQESINWIRGYDATELARLWQDIREGRPTPGFPSGKAFEYLILSAFEREGAEVVWPFEVRLDAETVEQIDGVVYAAHLSCITEAKDYQENVNFEPIAKLRNQLLRRPAGTIGLVFSRRGFTEPAKIMTRFTLPQTILLWEGAEFEYALENQRMVHGLRIKYRHAVEHGLPDYNLTGEIQ